MKRALIIPLTILALMTVRSAAAQQQKNNGDSHISITTDSDKVLDISSQGENNFAINIAGFKFIFGPNEKTDKQVAETDGDKWSEFEEKMGDIGDFNDKEWSGEESVAASESRGYEIDGTVNGRKKRAHRPSFESGIGYEIGLSMLGSVGYDLYPASSDFMELNQTKSIHMSFPLVSSGRWFNQAGSIGLSTGVVLTCDNYTFAHNTGLANTPDGMVAPFAPETSHKKSKLTTAALRAPLLLTIRMGQMKLTGGVYGECLINSHTKLKFPKEKEKLDGLNQLRYGFYANLGFGSGFYIYGETGRTELFKTDKGPNALPCSVGLGFKW